MTNTFIKGVGRLTTDRYDFQNHIDGNPPHHKAGIITLDPSVVINSVTHTNVQDAIEELAPFAVTVPDATSSVKGKIKLSGDLEGTADSPICHASYILSRPLGATPPSAGQVLTWTGISWSPDSIPVQFYANGDLGGSGLSQEVLAITGLTNNATIKCSDLTFLNTVTAPRIQHLTTTTGSGANLGVSAQTSTFGSGTGGNLSLSSGFGPAGMGATRLQLYTIPLLEISEPTSSNYVLSLVKGSAVTNTEMPTGTGNRVVYIANAASNPTVSPVSGTILYSSSGSLWVKESSGTNFQINDNNKLVFQNSVTEVNGSSALGGWSEFFSTTSEDYDYAKYTSTTVVEIGDIIKVSFNGYVGHTSSRSGYVCLLINGISVDILVPGTESFVSLGATTDPAQIALIGTYTVLASDTIKAVVALKVDPDNGDTMYMYGGASLIIEVIRP